MNGKRQVFGEHVDVATFIVGLADVFLRKSSVSENTAGLKTSTVKDDA